jgi:SPP1 family predicted phage head-tail adaptor
VGFEAGRLRHRVDIEVQSVTQDATSGGLTTTWAVEFQNVAAAIEPVSVREFNASAATQSQVTTRITIRYRPGLDATQRIVHGRSCCTADGEKLYNPEGFLKDKDSGLEYVSIPCSEGTNEG